MLHARAKWSEILLESSRPQRPEQTGPPAHCRPSDLHTRYTLEVHTRTHMVHATQP
jgi:hypothetical protein